MTEADILRRIERMQLRPVLRAKAPEYIRVCVEDATAYFKEYTHSEDIGEDLDPIICELAALEAGAEGAENTKHIKDGEIEREYFEDVPPGLRRRLNSYRRVQGL